MINFLNKLLDFYNISLDDYRCLTKEINIYDIPNINDFDNGIDCRDFLKSVIRNNKKILIFGDYDADGMLATSILVYTFKKLNFLNYIFYIPNRYIDGYGLSVDAVEKAILNNVDVIITVDNGICQNEAITIARKNNIDVIICDHHEIGDCIPDTKYIIHPFFSNNKDIICSGAFTSYILASSLLDLFEPYILSLAAISTISDMMKLVGYNRNIVRLGIKLMNENVFMQIKLLSDNLFIDEKVIGSVIAPKLNSVGRMIASNEINFIVDFLTSSDSKNIKSYFLKIQSLNDERKNITNDYEIDSLNNNSPCIVEMLDIKEGLLGLLANKYLNKFGKPTFFLTQDYKDKDILKGSARAKDGFSIVECLKKLDGILITYGGHESAGGFSLYKKDYDLFKEKIIRYCYSNVSNENQTIKSIKCIDIDPCELTIENYEILQHFSPFGIGNEEPIFRLSHIQTSSFTFSKDKKHIITKLSKEGRLIYFNFDTNILKREYVNIYGNMSLNVFNNFKSINFSVKSYE